MNTPIPSIRPELPEERSVRRGRSGVATVVAAAVALVGAVTFSGGAGPATAVAGETLTALGKPVTGGSTSDGSAANGLTMDLVRQFEADPMAAQGFTGAGIDVAVIDTGVSPVAGLDAPGKVLFGPDLSDEGASLASVGRDSYGHGTHMAGIIAGNDGLGAAGFRGMAPDDLRLF